VKLLTVIAAELAGHGKVRTTQSDRDFEDVVLIHSDLNLSPAVPTIG
jgi:hypothetical protein